MKGVRNALFGGGLLLTSVTGPGRIWWQTLSTSDLVPVIAPWLPGKLE